ncbi:putative proliferating cell nuclear antigen [Ordospora colligata]|uniref:DNA sliding clamp PCNA n=1 Tax=Ordospora colligata OC4 TaxID=1354746 RepID=A0A0B2UNF4_9MICR|nr:putative proliferating cell nuclear antigen [Ordospora colligata OC4]KHN70495.1 putative proliferating cell nuclear antigen [Ordospora colligata OC4]TBU17245.1 putative proliferating cell nuclear antigen [Ordospora colligata]TBU17495.1 putative proliferating cell nuclear antigen [Ordospora colligata]TBU19675.1 putative proliferating cell nuclear antigen [Ordospora colligata]
MFELELEAREKGKEASNASEALSLVKRVVESLSELVEQAEIKVSGRGMSIQVMDVMHVALADVFLPASMFTKYRCDRDLAIGVQLKTFVKILKGMSLDGGGMFRLECDDSVSSLNVKNARDGNSLNFKLKLFSSDSEAYNVPVLDFEATASIPTDEFMYVPRLVGTFGDFVGIKAEPGRLVFFQTGEYADASMSFEECEGKELKIDVKEGVVQEIAMKYVNLIGKVAGMCKSMSISLGNGKPVFFNLLIGESAYMKFYIAPKVEN